MKGIRILYLVFLAFVLAMPSNGEVVAAQELEWEGYIKSSNYNPNPVAPYTVIGDDTRVSVTDTDVYPYSAVARLTVVTKCGCCMEGSGFMVSKNCMLTAAHMLHCHKHNKGVKTIWVNFGKKDGAPALLSYAITADDAIIYYNPKYTKSDDYDYGYVVFNKDIGNTTGWYGLLGRPSTTAAAIAADANFIGKKVAVTGYADTMLYYGEGDVKGTLFPRIHYQVDTDEGESGGPVTFADGGTYAFAIHTKGIPKDSGIDYNSGWRITKEFMETLASHGYIEITE